MRRHPFVRFRAAKVVNYFELHKKKSLKKRFFVFMVQFSGLICQNHTAICHATHGDPLIKFQSIASEVKEIVRLLCVYCPSIVRE